jgi:hypothetical protein
MTTPDPTPETELDAQELTDENLEDVSGGAILVAGALGGSETVLEVGATGGNGGTGAAG